MSAFSGPAHGFTKTQRPRGEVGQTSGVTWVEPGGKKKSPPGAGVGCRLLLRPRGVVGKGFLTCVSLTITQAFLCELARGCELARASTGCVSPREFVHASVENWHVVTGVTYDISQVFISVTSNLCKPLSEEMAGFLRKMFYENCEFSGNA